MDTGVSPQKFLILLVGVAIAAGVGSALATGLSGRSSSSGQFVSSGSCNVIGVEVHGEIVSYPAASISYQPSSATSTSAGAYTASNEFQDKLRYYSQDPNIKALLIDIDSGGGGVVAGEELEKAVHHFGKPTVAVIHEMGASSAYLAASAADHIFASQNSAVGSIGVTQSFLNYAEKDKKDGITYIQLSSGPFKDWSVDKPFTEAERQLAMRDIGILKDNFVQMVADNRKLSFEKVNALADGSTLLGRQAVKDGLIDEIGGTDEAVKYLEGKIGEPANICWQ